MALAAGDQLGPYEILGALGAGGMGEVYKARDTRLGRIVAIKTSKEQFSDRFSREARAVAALNHTNVCHLYDVGPDYLVMEYVEGEDLRGPLDFVHALPVIRQLIDGIEAAHEKNIVHRDLKPANIKITHDGIVKILDFGLARIDEQERSGDPENSPTMTIGATAAGTILGTAAYMSPEQARGRQADRRSDIWSFGVILYELLTGKRLFEGESAVEILGEVLNKQPDLSATSPQARKLLAWCLEKDRKKRLQAIGDARHLLDEVPAVIGEAPSQSRPVIWMAAAALLLVALAGLSFFHFREKPPEARVVTTSIEPPEGTEFDLTQGVGLFALSPDGRKIVFGARSGGGKTSLWLRLLESQTAQPLPGTEEARFPFWSPDSRFIAFFADGKLKKIDTNGGPPVALADAVLGRGGSWNADGVIIFAPANAIGPLLRVPASGGTPAKVSEESGSLPWFLPDGKHFLFQNQAANTAGQYKVLVGSLDGSTSKAVATASTNAVYSDGHILFLREDTLMAQPFDIKSLDATGEAVPVAEHVARLLNSGRAAAISVSSSGLLVFRQGVASRGYLLTWIGRDGKELGKLSEDRTPILGRYQLSPDEKNLAVCIQNNQYGDIWIYDISRGLRTRLTFGNGRNEDPVWSPDGRRIAFRSNRSGRDDIYVKASDGTGSETLLYHDDHGKTPTSWSPDGRYLLYYTDVATSGPNANDIWALPVTVSANVGEQETQVKPIPFVQTNRSDTGAVFSPDGKWVAYQSDESGRVEIYVTPFPPNSGSGGKRQISGGGGSNPTWRRDGKELFFITPNNQVMAAELSTAGGTVEVRMVRELFRTSNIGLTNYIVAAGNGQRFLHSGWLGEGAAVPPTLVQNWTAGLRR